MAVCCAKDPEHLLFRMKATYMTPCLGPLPNKLLLAGSLAWWIEN
ncbi:hypothetical protein CY35_14G069800 [Sphagnum magellanicum]|nr:hypothetical protein CY35_14G069800 [Sphagnum magellanicum]